jgi:hypothetical protein
MEEHRRAIRVEVSVGAVFQAAESFFYAETGDLSETGLLLHAQKPLPVGTHLHLTFGLPPDLPRIATEAVVKWQKGGEGVGIEFVNLTPEDKERITAFLKSGAEKKP